MRICIIGKFPPIQGGVAVRTYWVAHDLAARGHEVHVVTNAKEASAIRQEALIAMRFSLGAKGGDKNKLVGVLIDAASDADRALFRYAVVAVEQP